ncbi:MAG TPA: AMP-binding protein [Rhizobiaceae bacterium]|nr:AMP-binding protein [Rhizobiaceae bacterium]
MNLAHLLLRSACRWPDNSAVTHAGRSWTYGELARRVLATSGALRSTYGLKRGDRIALAMNNQPEFFQIIFAAWHAGLCVAPMNAKLHPREFAYIIENVGASMCIASPTQFKGIAEATDHLKGLHLLSTDGDALQALQWGAPQAEDDMRPEDPAWIFYTSGTTGRPKGATLTIRNLTFMSHAYYAEIDGVGPDDAMFHPAPLSHGAGLYSLPHIARGGHQVIPAAPHFDPGEVLDLLARYKNVSFIAPPTLLTRLMSSAEGKSTALENLKTIIVGGSPAYVADLERALEIFGPKIVQLYAQGETPCTATLFSKAEYAALMASQSRIRLGSCGTARLGVELRVVNDNGQSVPAGEVGEIITRSDCVMQGYWNDPAATAQAIRDGWLYTGDVGRLDADGYLYVMDRSKDMIISGGSNIYPREIEDVLLQHDAVLEASVVGVPHPDWGEEVVACVVLKPGSAATEQDLDQICLAQIARFKRPKRYLFVQDLPKSSYGKVLKTELRARLAEQLKVNADA